MTKHRVPWICLPVVSTVLVVVALGAVSAAPAATGPGAASGTYDTPNPIPPVVSVDPDDPTVFHVEISNSTIFYGTFEGTTQYSGSGTYDPATKRSEGDLVEVFTGVVAGVGTGTVTFAEHFTSAPTDSTPDGTGLTLLDADITSATGELRGLTGHLHFEGVSDANSVGTGTYVGTIDASQVVPDTTTTTEPAPVAVVRPAYTG